MTPAEHAAIDEHVRRIVADWPPLTPAQLDRLAVLLRPRSGRFELSVPGCTMRPCLTIPMRRPSATGSRRPGSPPSRIEQHHAAGRVRVDGQLVEDLDQAAPVPASIVIAVD